MSTYIVQNNKEENLSIILTEVFRESIANHLIHTFTPQDTFQQADIWSIKSVCWSTTAFFCCI